MKLRNYEKTFLGNLSLNEGKNFIGLPVLDSSTGRKNGFGPNLHLANLSKFGEKIQQTSSNDGKCRICYSFCTGL